MVACKQNLGDVIVVVAVGTCCVGLGSPKRWGKEVGGDGRVHVQREQGSGLTVVVVAVGEAVEAGQCH